jgi:hypothetical protein
LDQWFEQDFDRLPGEQLLFGGDANYGSPWIYRIGTAYVTNQRLLFASLGAWIFKYRVDLPLDAIDAAGTDISWYFSWPIPTPGALWYVRAAGKRYVFRTRKRTNWIAAIKAAREAYD